LSARLDPSLTIFKQMLLEFFKKQKCLKRFLTEKLC
jgi:hypothetical protein